MLYSTTESRSARLNWTTIDFQMTSTTTHSPRHKSKWNRSFTVAANVQQTLSAKTTMRWNTSFTDVVTGQLTS